MCAFLLTHFALTEPQVFPYQAEACQVAEAEPSCAPMDPSPHQQLCPVRSSLTRRDMHHLDKGPHG